MNVQQLAGMRQFQRMFGRTSRTTLVTWVVVITVARLALTYFLVGSLLTTSGGGDLAGRDLAHPLAEFIELISTLILLVFQARRFHDQDRSGLFALVPLTAYFGFLWLAEIVALLPGPLAVLLAIIFIGYLIALFLPPTVGPNRFGPDPRGWRSPEHRAAQDAQLRQ